jgi:hypothetical protein
VNARSAPIPKVERRYTPSPDACFRALQLILESKKAIGHAPEPNSRNDEKESNGNVATEKYTG